MIGDIKQLLIIPHIHVHNANALSSPFTIGFPAMTAWLGAVHAIQRKLNAQDIAVRFNAVGVVSHAIDLHTYKGDNDFVHSIVATANPLDKTGARSAFIEEARCRLEASLVIEFTDLGIDDHAHLLSSLTHLLNAGIKIAGGDIMQVAPPFVMVSKDGDDRDLRQLQRALMPGYVLIERRDLMVDAMKKGADALEALIDYIAIHHHCNRDDDNNIVWHSHRKSIDDKPAGWIVPIATGFHAISELGAAKNQRDPDTPHRFAESVVTLGEFIMPYRLHAIEDLLWRYHVDNNLYLCQQRGQYSTTYNTATTINEAEFDD